VVGSQHDPAAEGVAQVDDSRADHEPDDIGQRTLQGQDKDIVSVEETEIPGTEQKNFFWIQKMSVRSRTVILNRVP